MSKGPTILDLAREADVSVATVDRVLNGRLRVREETAQRVYAAAQKIGYHGTNAIRQRVMADLPEYHLGFILRKERQAFYQDFAAHIEAAVRRETRVRLRATIQFAGTQTPGEAAEMLKGLAGKVHAVAASAVDHHETTAAVSTLRLRGIPTFSLLSDFAQGVRESYVGTNNLKVGRSVGWLMSKLPRRPGKVAVVIGGHRWHGHELRETGFRSYLREYAPEFQVLDTMINLETRQLTHEAVLELLEKHPDLAGLYVAGGGMEGAISALREARKPDEVAVIVNEITPESRLALLDRYVSVVMATPLPQLCTELVSLMVHAIENGLSDTPGQRFMPITFLTPEDI